MNACFEFSKHDCIVHWWKVQKSMITIDTNGKMVVLWLGSTILEVLMFRYNGRQFDALKDECFLLGILDGILGKILNGFHRSNVASDINTLGSMVFREGRDFLYNIPCIHHNFCH